MSFDDEPVQTYLRAIQREWQALYLAVVVLAIAAVPISRVAGAPLAQTSASVFYVNALVNTAALVWAFAMQHQLTQAAHRTPSAGSLIKLVDNAGRKAIFPLATAGIFASTAVVTTGEWINLAFIPTTLGFGALYFPSSRRFRVLYRSEEVPPIDEHQ